MIQSTAKHFFMPLQSIPDICHFFPQGQFLLNLSPRKKGINCDQTGFATKQCQVLLNAMNFTHYFSTFMIFITFLMWRTVFHMICHAMWRISHFLNIVTFLGLLIRRVTFDNLIAVLIK